MTGYVLWGMIGLPWLLSGIKLPGVESRTGLMSLGVHILISVLILLYFFSRRVREFFGFQSFRTGAVLAGLILFTAFHFFIHRHIVGFIERAGDLMLQVAQQATGAPPVSAPEKMR